VVDNLLTSAVELASVVSRVLYPCTTANALRRTSTQRYLKHAVLTISSEVRGALVALQQLAITFGIMISFWINYGTNYIGGTTLETQSNAAWMVPICLQLVPAFVLLVGMIWMPFSPRWLMHHGREAEARKNLASLRDLSEDHELIELEFLEIKAQSMFEKRSLAEKFPHLQEMTALNTLKLQFVAIGALFKTKAMFKRVIVATVTMFFQQWSGINAVL
jgi:MFS family permease